MPCLCWSRMNQYPTKHVQVRFSMIFFCLNLNFSSSHLGFILTDEHFFVLLLSLHFFFALFVLCEFFPWKLCQVKFLRKLQIIVQFLPYHVLYIKLKSFQCKYQNIWKVIYECSLYNTCLFPHFFTKYLIVKSLRPEKVHKGLIQCFFTFYIKRDVIKMFLLVLVESFTCMLLREKSQLLRIASTKNRVDFGLYFAGLYLKKTWG